MKGKQKSIYSFIIKPHWNTARRTDGINWGNSVITDLCEHGDGLWDFTKASYFLTRKCVPATPP